MTEFKLTLGPLLFNWKANDWRDFYFKMADTSIAEVYLGEAVCYKRFPFFEIVMDEVIERLTKSNIKVHISTLSLMLGDLEINSAKKLIEKYSDKHLIEVNDMGVLGLLEHKKHIIGPTINVYNENTANILEQQGALRICFPYELDKASIKIIAQNTSLDKEVFCFGRAPLAIAARCYHARIHNTTKDDCRYVCEKDYNGKVISTLTDTNFLTVNGTQTMSYSYFNLINEVCDLNNMGVKYFRLSPHDLNMQSVIGVFDDVLNKKIDGTEGYAKLLEYLPNNSTYSNGFYYGGTGREYLNKNNTNE